MSRVRRTSSLLVCTIAALLGATAQAQPRGYGVVAKINDRDTDQITSAKNTAHISAIQSWFDWSELEPNTPGVYDWTLLDNWFDDVTSGTNGKKAVLVIMPINGKDPSKASNGTTRRRLTGYLTTWKTMNPRASCRM